MATGILQQSGPAKVAFMPAKESAKYRQMIGLRNNNLGETGPNNPWCTEVDVYKVD
jgi:hypothetical protein